MQRFLKISISYLLSSIVGLLFFANVEAAFAETQWQGLVLGEITFSAPADWNVTHQTPNEIRLESRDSKTRLLVFWWTPDEPLLGYDDIVSHEKRTVSGKGALYIYSRFPDSESLKLVFNEPRKNGQRLIVLEESDTADFSKGSPIFDEIIASMDFGDGADATTNPQKPNTSEPALLEKLKLHINADCEAIDLGPWTHPVRDEVEKRSEAHLLWAALCDEQRYPVFGMEFDYDPNGQTNDFFRPLFYDLLQANGRWPYAIIVPSSKLMIVVSGKSKSAFKVDYQDAPEFAEPNVATTAIARVQAYLPSPDTEEARIWLGPVSFEAPSDWSTKPDEDGRTMRIVSPDRLASITITLWPSDRPMPSEGVTSVDFTIVAGEPAQSFLQKTGKSETRHLFFEEALGDGSRIAVSYRADGEVEALYPILELFFASFNRSIRAPGAPVLPTARLDNSDPFADIAMEELLR